jgi:hypothetical protein
MKKLAVIFMLSIIFSACAGKKEYPIAEMPQALFLTEPGEQGKGVVFEGSDCGALGPITGDAFQALEVLVAAGNRRTGSQAYRCAAEAARNALDARGWEAEFQTYLFPYYQVEEDGFSVTRLEDGQRFPAFPVMYSMPTTELPGGEVKAKVVKADGAVQGGIVYLKLALFSSHLKETVQKLAEKGAVGFIVEADLSPIYSKGLPYAIRGHETSWHYGPLPGLVVANAKELIGQEVILTNQSRIVPGRGWNVIAKTPGDYQDYVLVTAHLDSWYQGALDDASGSAVVIELARRLASKPSGPTGVILFLADGEEIGLYGSAAFIREFGFEKVKAVVELDMVSRKNDYGKRGPAEAKVLPRINTAVPVMKPIARRAFAEWPGKYYLVPARVSRAINGGGLGSDMEWFYFAGVPGLMIWTPSRYYHTEKDDLAYMDAADLEAVTQAVARLVEELRDQPVAREVPNHVDFDFAAEVKPDGQIGLQVKLPQRLGRAKVKVSVLYENGVEQSKLDLKKDQDGVWRGEYLPAYSGTYQCLAWVSAGKKFGKKWVVLSASARPAEKGPSEP